MGPDDLKALLATLSPRPWYYPDDGRLVIKAEKGGDYLLTSCTDLNHRRAKTTLKGVTAALNRAELLCELWALAIKLEEEWKLQSLHDILAKLKEAP